LWNKIKYGAILIIVTNIFSQDFWTQAMNSHYSRRVSHFNNLPVKKGAIIFIGDSITEQCNWSELFDNPEILNRGIGGDVLEGVAKRLEFLKTSEPAALFLMIGINNMNRGDPNDEIFLEYKLLVEKIEDYNPSTKLFLQSILPINQKLFIGIPIASNESIESLNQNIQKLAENMGAVYVNLYSHFLNTEGELDKKYSNDGLHLSCKGYILWKEIVNNYIHDI
jgi:lysophospholipase L1-like esterase